MPFSWMALGKTPIGRLAFPGTFHDLSACLVLGFQSGEMWTGNGNLPEL